MYHHYNSFNADKPVKKLMDLNSMKGEQCVIVGTLYKNQELKPSVLRDVSKEVRIPVVGKVYSELRY